VVAAAIGVTGTVIVGLAGFGATIWTTRQTAASARESRIWDRRAAAYVDVLAAIQSRQTARTTLISILRDPPHNDKDSRVVSIRRANNESPNWHDLEARLHAFASESVFTAVQASSTAAGDFHRAAEVAQETPAPLDTALKATEAARQAADDADDEVVERIRTELQGRGRPLGDWHSGQGPEPPTV